MIAGDWLVGMAERLGDAANATLAIATVGPQVCLGIRHPAAYEKPSNWRCCSQSSGMGPYRRSQAVRLAGWDPSMIAA